MDFHNIQTFMVDRGRCIHLRNTNSKIMCDYLPKMIFDHTVVGAGGLGTMSCQLVFEKCCGALQVQHEPHTKDWRRWWWHSIQHRSTVHLQFHNSAMAILTSPHTIYWTIINIIYVIVLSTCKPNHMPKTQHLTNHTKRRAQWIHPLPHQPYWNCI